MNQSIIIFLITLTVITHEEPFLLNLEKYSDNFTVACQRNIHIDFFFSENTKMICDGTCSLQNGELSSLQTYDFQYDEHWNMSLESAGFVEYSFVEGRSSVEWRSFAFKFTDNLHTFYIIIPVTNNTQTDQSKLNISYIRQNFDILEQPYTQYEQLAGFAKLTNLTQPTPLSIFNFLNIRDLGVFYNVGNPVINVTVLLSIRSYLKEAEYFDQAVPPTFENLILNYEETARRSCFGSDVVQSIFLTHLADNYPLWTGWMGAFFFWGYFIFSTKNTPQCFQQRFRDNKWTSWSVYSLFYLGHTQFFTKLARTTNMMISFSWQAVVISITLYNSRLVYEPAFAAWIISLNVLVTQPISYIFGTLLVRRIHMAYIQKFESVERLIYYMQNQRPISLKEKHSLEMEVLEKDQKLYELYFLYYGIAIPVILSCWAVAVHLLQETYNGDSHLHPIWTYCFVSAWVADVFVVEPLLCCIFGNKKFFRNRGFFYNYSLGEKFTAANKKRFLARLDL